MHPVDQFEAFSAMADEGKSVADIAARFGKTVAFVRGRMALARVAPALLELYRNEEIDFNQLTAFTLSDDHERQIAVWESLPYWNTSAASIRRALQTDTITASDRRMRFIGGMEAYEAAGGAVKRYLFDDENSGYATDVALVEKLVADKLESHAATVRAEGWKWVECVASLPTGLWNFKRVYPHTIPLTDEQQAELEKLEAELDAVNELFAREEATEADEETHASLEQRIEDIRDQGEAYLKADMEQAGCYVFVNHNGEIGVECGLILLEDEDDSLSDDDQSQGSSEVPDVAEAEKPAFVLSAAMVQELTAQKTAAIRAELAHNPNIALVSVVHSMMMTTFLHKTEATCLELRVTSEPLRNSIRDADNVQAIQTMDDMRENYGDTIPGNPDDLWDWCMTRDQSELLNVLAFVAASSVNAVQCAHYSRSAQRSHADRLAEALGMDMRSWFTPTAANYFSRISKTGIEAALAEAKGVDFAAGVSGMKKADAVAYAERQVAGTGWLPAQLRLAGDSMPVIPADADDDDQNDDNDDNDELDSVEFSEAAE
uniref:ParB-like partitioning protein n=1 Tax=Ochrobactrum sp. LM19 TaxID=1449781 RepID=A0A0D5A0W1_9HYPH|nr:chromosome partitioning protein ParB [Ochrobactrum sp. LM19]AJW29950.1 ParB-like partitioning protein [Ochrobactrum sp. LM19]